MIVRGPQGPITQSVDELIDAALAVAGVSEAPLAVLAPALARLKAAAVAFEEVK